MGTSRALEQQMAKELALVMANCRTLVGKVHLLVHPDHHARILLKHLQGINAGLQMAIDSFKPDA